MKVSLNIIRREGYVFVNICEPELIGKTFKEGEVNLVINKEFYEGQEVSLDYAFSLLDEANVVSIVGNKIIEEAVKRGFLKEEGVISIQGVKFAQIYNM
ncbi:MULTISPECIES: DUF424 domain-containing protein [Sulfurisphaera]|uniref:DUF424 domain-containing protein n=3 Tax=Sulfurisphaera TaxID=69655 RepID=F9VN20_SULTO|nr:MULTISPECIES: DUF424 family protein [Sulfurisphaera]MBB5252896.1 hypothetical protein [Sulfurisphaera ohwakuensis]QGR16172.1 DUF424 family protein [Sulfurisphaera ohwakuensis]BAK54317.1 hypothetical protein STK_05170 [Sulfurisphaera tokodaii str. 7]HII74788.1 DUF424 family protein [Sulfurisphaera tokodaii]